METILFLLFWLGGAAMHTVVELHLKARKAPRSKGAAVIADCRIRDPEEM